MARRDAAIEAMEEQLLEAWDLLMRSPDRERAFLHSGRRSAWPEILRDRVTDYADDDARPRLQLNRRQVALRDRVFVDVDCLTMAIAPTLLPMVATVLAMKARPGAGGFRWERVWEALGGRESGTTTDGLAKRYERVLRRLIVVEALRNAPVDAPISGLA
jgi:hypothetical protein